MENRAKRRWLLLAGILAGALAIGCGGGSGACVGSGGALSSPVCKADWDQSECEDWNTRQVNGAGWSFHSGAQCASLGYSEKCSDGSYRLPGHC